jgi:5'-nucleotidase
MHVARGKFAVRSYFVGLAVLLAAGLVLSGVSPAEGKQPKPHFWLTVLHNNDGESQLIDAGSGLEDFGGAARFATLAANLKFEAEHGPRSVAVKEGGKRGVVMVSSGDNYLAGPEFNASLAKGVPFFDTLVMDAVGYDAIAIGNHEFDFGPDVLADFISGFVSDVPFLSANLDVSGEPRLQAFANAGRITGSTVVEVRGEQIGIIGATTPNLPFISSPRNVVVDADVVGAIQGEIDQLEAFGINKIVLISHLQSIGEDLDLIPQLSGVDIAVAGGGDELLANPETPLVPGDESAVFDCGQPRCYPLFTQDADGNDVLVVTTSGAYRYVGRLVAGFDKAGRVLTFDVENSGPVRVSGVAPDAVTPDPEVEAQVTAPVALAVAGLEANIIGNSEVGLDGIRGNVRTVETNEGNLLADAQFHVATERAASFGVPAPDVALQNGGGIRNDSIIGPGDITELDTFDIAPFSNFVVIIPNIPRDQFKEILENAVSRVESVSGRFAQISGFSFTYDAAGTPQELDGDGNVVTPGTRVTEVALDDGTPIVVGGAVQAGPDLTVATINFLATGGDQYPFRGAAFTSVGITYQQALSDFIQDAAGLNGLISAADYPEGGEGRITRLN